MASLTKAALTLTMAMGGLERVIAPIRNSRKGESPPLGRTNSPKFKVQGVVCRADEVQANVVSDYFFNRFFAGFCST
jgi:hypothetical protein